MERVNNENVKISVVMPTYNTDIPILKDAVNSILTQTYGKFEFIIIDDCSQNGTQEYFQSIQDDRVKVIRNADNLGVTKSLNIGLKAAKGEYIARMDADDIALPERLEKQLDFMESHPNVVVCGTWIQAFGDKHYTQKRLIPDREYLRCSMLFGNHYGLCHPTAMFRASELRKHNIRYDEELSTAQDYGMWSVCCEYGDIANVPEILLNYRIHDKQISVAKRNVQIQCTQRVQQNLLKRLACSLAESVNSFYDVCNIAGYTKVSAKWMRSILKANKTKGIYDKKILKKFLKDYKYQKINELVVQHKLPQSIFKIYRNTHISAYADISVIVVKKIFKRN